MRYALLLSCLFAVGCVGPTQFQGNAKYPGGALGCYNACQSEQMVMSAFVYTGEFATSCVCTLQPAGGPQQPQPAGQPAGQPATGAEVAPSAGVIVQARAAQAAAEAEQRRQQEEQEQRGR